ncbi:hypothetical protein [Hamadaea tsunoensis]|uniref:hypothetical protein n=1 Tax=Hamadaea tsunoensis TaxID=53368 RepID=UPI000426B441|nr:hypothetical protein [Hamadaea tsunoensis]
MSCRAVPEPHRGRPGRPVAYRKPTTTIGGRLPAPEITAALVRGLLAGLFLRAVPAGPRWGVIACVRCRADRAVWAAPSDPAGHARQVDRFIQQHDHTQEP